MQTQPNRLVAVDLLRSFAILAVLATHLKFAGLLNSTGIPRVDFVWAQFAHHGGNGVEIFFTLSGYLITRSIARRGDLLKVSPSDFYSRRIARLLPLLLASVAIGLSLIVVSGGASEALKFCLQSRPLDWPLWVSIATLSVNWLRMVVSSDGSSYGLHWDILWSLAIEEQFYLGYPWLLRLIGSKKRLTGALLFLVALGIAVRWAGLAIAPDRPYLSLLNSFGCFDLIALGALAYLVEQRFSKPLHNQFLRVAMGGAGALMAGTAYLIDFGQSAILGRTQLGLGVFLLLIAFSNFNPQNKFWALLTLPGKLSYGIYLLHGAILFVLWDTLKGMNPLIGCAIYWGVGTAIGWVSFTYFEEPLNKKIRNSIAPKT